MYIPHSIVKLERDNAGNTREDTLNALECDVARSEAINHNPFGSLAHLKHLNTTVKMSNPNRTSASSYRHADTLFHAR